MNGLQYKRDSILLYTLLASCRLFASSCFRSAWLNTHTKHVWQELQNCAILQRSLHRAGLRWFRYIQGGGTGGWRHWRRRRTTSAEFTLKPGSTTTALHGNKTIKTTGYTVLKEHRPLSPHDNAWVVFLFFDEIVQYPLAIKECFQRAR